MSSRSVKRRPSNRQKAAAAEPEYLVIGKVLRPHGVRGELRIQMHSHHPSHLSQVETVYLGEDHRPHKLKSFRLHQRILLMTLEGFDDRDKADTLREELVSVKVDQAVPLEEGEYFYHQIIGLSVVTDEGEVLGAVAEIIRTGANDVYVVRGQGGEVLLPAIRSVILKIEPPQMIVHLLPGLRPEG